MHNEVVLEGELPKDPVERELKTGERVWLFQVAVPQVSGEGHDRVDCSVRSGRMLRVVAAWRAGDRVRIVGHLRRRFFTAGGVSRSTLEVSVQTGRRARRAAAA
ncbi:single-stranded DNA-binding protein [Nocardioides alcanivorans]|uniref:single-stranded DNA-binding protein n=1 Tax=Nocardioides alcanivorans TaxID=2897352 RepID=UPI001F2F3A94|nr:single-stranded DNA-binding protein [Nocardioides alcanivorans]